MSDYEPFVAAETEESTPPDMAHTTLIFSLFDFNYVL